MSAFASVTPLDRLGIDACLLPYRTLSLHMEHTPTKRDPRASIGQRRRGCDERPQQCRQNNRNENVGQHCPQRDVAREADSHE